MPPIDAAAELPLRRLPRLARLIPPESRKRIVAFICSERTQPDTSRGLGTRYDDFVRRCTVWRN
jgi:hypothetical protein